MFSSKHLTISLKYLAGSLHGRIWAYQLRLDSLTLANLHMNKLTLIALALGFVTAAHARSMTQREIDDWFKRGGLYTATGLLVP